jgi:hypothetical protein
MTCHYTRGPGKSRLLQYQKFGKQRTVLRLDRLIRTFSLYFNLWFRIRSVKAILYTGEHSLKRISIVASLLVAAALTIALLGGPFASAAPHRQLERVDTPPHVVGMKLPAAEEELERHGWIPKPFNTDTLFGIIVKSHYTVCKQYPPVGHKVRLLAQKYGC